ncbi:MAG: ATP-binding cassette domain-containing protein [Paracoccaceae bacterium]
MLRIEGLSVRLGDFSLAADFQVEQGRIIAVVGPSGAGKSTLMAVIAGFVAPDAGRVFWQDQDIGALPPGKRPLSMLFQDQNLFPHLTVWQNLALGLDGGMRPGEEQRRRMAEVLQRTGLKGLADRKPAALSGGQQSRAALARALLRARPLLILDEPFAALGPGLRAEMLSLVHETAQESGLTVLMVTHDPKDAAAIADETLLVADGRAHAPRPTAALFADPPPALAEYLGR